MSALIEKCSVQSGDIYDLSEILQEVDERSTVANQHQVLSSTVKGIFSQKEYFNKDIASEDNKGYKVVRRGQVVLSPQNLWMGKGKGLVGFALEVGFEFDEFGVVGERG